MNYSKCSLVHFESIENKLTRRNKGFNNNSLNNYGSYDSLCNKKMKRKSLFRFNFLNPKDKATLCFEDKIIHRNITKLLNPSFSTTFASFNPNRNNIYFPKITNYSSESNQVDKSTITCNQELEKFKSINPFFNAINFTYVSHCLNSSKKFKNYYQLFSSKSKHLNSKYRSKNMIYNYSNVANNKEQNN